MILRYYRWMLVAVAAGFVGGIVLADLVPTGHWRVTTDFQRDSPWIRHLWPPGRVGEPIRLSDGRTVMPVTIEPVYFDVWVPRSFRSVQATITFATRPPANLRIGVARERNVWGGVFSLLKEQSHQASSWTGSAILPLNGIHQHERRLQWVFSSPGLDPTHPLLIQSIDLSFTRPSLYRWIVDSIKHPQAS